MVATRKLSWIWTLVLAGAVLFAIPAAAQDEAEPAAAEEAPPVEEAPPMDDPAAGEADTAGMGGEEELGEALPSLSDEEFVAETLDPLGFVLDMFQQGGWAMWPLLFSSVVALAVILERFWTLSRARVNVRKLMGQIVGALKEHGVDGAIEVCQRTRGPIAAILHAGLMRARKGPEAVEKAIESAGTIEMSFLQRGLIVLASVANVAPLIGFLGTVSGMIRAFNDIAAAEQVSAKIVAAGISEALITTAAGLLIAIPTQISNNFFISRIDRFVLEMEEASVELVDTLVDIEAHRGA